MKLEIAIYGCSITNMDYVIVAEIPYRRDPNRHLKSSGGDGTFSDMEARVKALEEQFIKIDAKLDKINDDVKEIKGKLSNPSTWQMMGICAALIGFVISGGGIAFTLAKFLQA